MDMKMRCMMKGKLLKIAVFLLVFALFWGCGEKAKSGDINEAKEQEKNVMQEKSAKRDAMLPDFVLPDLAGKEHRLAEHIGKKTVLLVFWTTGCRYCVAEIPRLNKMFEELKDDLDILSINIFEPQSMVEHMVKSKGIKYPVLLDKRGDTARDYRVRGVPTMVLIDREGQMGYYGHDLSEAIKKIKG